MPRIKHDLALGLGSQFVFKIIGFGTIALLARYLPQEDFGRLSLALSICTLAVMFTDLGYSNDAIRKIAANPDTLHERLGLVISLRLPLLVVFLISINVIVWVSKPDLLPVTLGIALSVAFKDLHKSYAAAFIACRRNSRNIISFGVGLMVVLLGVACASYFNLGLAWIVGFHIIGGAITLLLSAGQFYRIYGSIVVRIRGCGFRRHVFSAFLLFALTGFSYAHFAIDNIALGYLGSYNSVATFAAAATLLEASQFAIRPLTQIMFPICAMLCMEHRWGELTKTLRKMYGGAIVVGVVAWVFVMVLADQIVNIVYSSNFEESAEILRVLYASVPGLFVTSVGVFVAASLHRERQACVVLCMGLAIKLIFFPVVVPPYGPIGVAWLNFSTQSLIACWLIFDTYRCITLRSSVREITVRDLP